MLFTDEFLSLISDEPIASVIEINRVVRTAWGKIANSENNGWSREEHAIALETFALLKEITESGIISYPSPDFEVGTDANLDCENVSHYLSDLTTEFESKAQKKTVEVHQQRFKLGLGKIFAYEFSQGDYERVQTLINELRGLISDSKGFEKEHQRRLLARLERLQGEMHKKVSDLDHFWGLIGDAGVALGKLGNDAKPIVDRIREIAGITWNTQSRAEELPSGTSFPQLEHKPTDEA